MEGYELLRTKIFDGEEAVARLALLGLSVEDLHEIVRRGEYARAGATAFDPLTAEGYDAFRHRVRTTRELLCPRGWTMDREAGLELTRSPCSRWAIITRGGDHGVGIRELHPQPKRTPGESTTRAIYGNHTIPLDADWLNSQSREDEELPSNTWMLLVCRGESDDVRSELSLPKGGSGTNGQKFSWLERILLPTLDLASPEDTKRGTNDPGEPAEIDVPVSRKR